MTMPRSLPLARLRFAAPSSRRIARRLRRFTRAADGLAAVEFALILPVMIALYFGMAEVTVGIIQDRKLDLVARAVADLPGRAGTMDDATMKTIFAAAANIMAPYDTSKVKITVTSVVVKKNSGGALEAKGCWSKTHTLGNFDTVSDGARKDQTITPIAEGFQTEGVSYIWAEVEKPYSPTIGYKITGEIKLTSSTPWPVRNVTQVSYDTGSSTPKTC
ncbi:MAG TPA: TadE/TadG family type IV pilus assembly protein [Beijerinckiaceae bacterium]|jgi:Flp pilus assembly protein TadG